MRLHKEIDEGIQKKDWKDWEIDNFALGTYFFNGNKVNERDVQNLINEDYDNVSVNYVEINKLLDKMFVGKTLGDLANQEYAMIFGKDVDLALWFDLTLEELKSVQNGKYGFVTVHATFSIPSTHEIYSFGLSGYVEVNIEYGSMFLESKKSARKSIKESVKLEIQRMVNRIIDDLIGEYSSKEWDRLSDDEKFDIIENKYDFYYEFYFNKKNPKDLLEIEDLVIENMNHPFNVVFESKKSLKEKTDVIVYQKALENIGIPKKDIDKNALAFAIKSMASLYNSDEYESEDAIIYVIDSYLSYKYPSWEDEFDMHDLAKEFYDGTIKWKDIDSSWFN